MAFLLIPIIFGFATASMAKGKNRSPVTWFFIGMVLCPFAPLLLLLMKAGPGPDHGYE